MTPKYYLKNLIWPFIPVLVVLYEWFAMPQTLTINILLPLSIINFFLYPYAKLAITNIAIKFKSKEFWDKDFFTSSVGGSFQAILFIFCYIFAIPLSCIYLLVREKAPS